MNAVFDSLGRFERSRTDQNDPDFANLQLLNPAPVAPAAVSSLPPPPYSQPLPTLLSMLLSMPSLPVSPQSYLPISFLPVSLLVADRGVTRIAA